MQQGPGYICFYGTLMRGFDLRRRSGIDPLIQFVARGVFRAALFDLGPYPAAIRAAGRVHGEVYAMVDPVQLLPRVDAIEGYVPGSVLHSQYTRELVPVRLELGGQKRAWVYFYERQLGDAAWVPSGDYRRHVTRGRLGCQLSGL